MILLIIIVFSLILRLYLLPLGFHVDILSNAGWGQWIYTHGPMGFYENNIWIYSWPTQPPFVSLIYGFDNWLYIFLLELFRNIGHFIVRYHLAPGHMIWWFSFTKWFDVAKISTESVFLTGYLITIKLLPVLADIGIALIIYLIAVKQKVKNVYIWPTVFLLAPFSWYLSALWGQYDQLAFLPVLSAFILASQKKFRFATPILLALGIAIKPTSLILVPYFLYIYLKNRPKFYVVFTSLIAIIIFYIISTKVFTDQNLLYFSKTTLIKKIFFKTEPRLSVNAFNFWRLLQINGLESYKTLFIFIPAYLWSMASFIYFNLVAIKFNKVITTRNMIVGLFIVSTGSWLFMTNMLDRYLFAGIVSGLIATIYNYKLFKYWLLLSLIYWLNLYNQWWFPDSFRILENILVWQNGLITKLLAILNIIVFLKMSHILTRGKQ
jgi:hypothetical protein